MVTEYSYTLQDLRQQFKEWIADGNAIKVDTNKYKEQTTQWRRIFTYQQLKDFFIQEYFINEVSPLDIILFKIKDDECE